VSIARDKYLPSHNRQVAVPKHPTTIGGHLRRRRLQLKVFQSEAARRLRVSMVTLSRWECDKVYPTWEHHPSVIDYLGYDPFPSCGLQDPYSNESPCVANLRVPSLGKDIRKRRLELKLTVKECARTIGVDAKTLRGWEGGIHWPDRAKEARITQFLGSNPFQASSG
jgi:transcriptional regulator with XRE-family HTH domain